MILGLIDEAVRAGARQEKACEILGLSARAVQRWRRQGGGEDRRRGPHSTPPNALSAEERQGVLEILNDPEHQDRSPKQIVPSLADQGVYVASESTMYRILREEDQLGHRERSRPPVHRRPEEFVADGPCQVWTWDITYLASPVRGQFYYLYMILDVWSRKIVGVAVHDRELSDLAADLFCDTCAALDLDPEGLVFHSDNGGPMKGSTMLATLQRLGVVASFSRPSVSDDNPFSEALFRTTKYRPDFPDGPFASLEAARDWVEAFVTWYNTEHLHSALRFVTPDDRHFGREAEILERRRQVYEMARRQNPERWSRGTRNWEPVEHVKLNPRKESKQRTLRQAA
jgi:transposase InsO family protein